MQAAIEKRKQSDTASVPTSKSAFLQAESTESHTVIQTAPKGGHRVAHRPSSVGNIFKVNGRHDEVNSEKYSVHLSSTEANQSPTQPLIFSLFIYNIVIQYNFDYFG
jgi:hypothetical protein